MRLRYLECMDHINQVIHQSDDAEQMLWRVLRAALSMFDCDRIWLFYPCDPESPTYRIPVEVTRREYPGAKDLNLEVPMKPMGDRFCAKALATDGPVLYGADTDPPIFRELTDQFGVRSQMSMAIHPRVGKPWMLGMHQCSHERIWSEDDQRLFEGVARRIGEGLSTLLLLRDLRESQERFDLAVKGSRDGLWDWPDVMKDEMWWSPRVYEMFGYEPDEITPSAGTLKELVHPEDLELVRTALRDYFQGSEAPSDLRFRIRRRSGEYSWIWARAISLCDEYGKVRRLSGSFADVTERVRVEEELGDYRSHLEELVGERTAELNRANAELNRAKELAEEASRAKSEFLATMSHEIRTPLTIVMASIEHLLNISKDPQQKSILQLANDSADRLHNLIEDVLDFSRIEARRVEIRREAFDLPSVLGKTVDLFRMQAQERGLELQVEVDPGAPVRIHGDPERLAQVLINLVGNAVKFTERGTVTVGISHRADSLIISVRDTGIGIAEDKRNRLFQSFSQVDSSLTRKYGGTGLGLAISKALVELMGGTLWVESVEGEGSVFSFTLPLWNQRRSDPRKTFAEERQKAPAPLKASGTYRILLVDDDPQVRNILSLMLLDRHWEVVTAFSGKQAVQEVMKEAFDLILMDLQMPDMSGLETTRVIREHESAAGRRTPIIALTAHVRLEDKEKCLEAGMNGFLGKPVSMERLYTTVEKLLGSASRSG